jgi:biopolymer transport protein ExbB
MGVERMLSRLLCTASLWFFLASAALAAESEALEPAVQKKSVYDLFRSTGPVGIMLVILSVIGTSLLVQYYVRYREKNLGNPEFLQQVESLLNQGNADEAFELAHADDSYAGRVIAGALKRRSAGYEEVKESLLESAGVETFRLNARISYLSLVGNIGPLLGLLGTVTGMISSFQVIEQLKAPTPGDLAKGVYESLVNTTMGLFIAIIFLTAYFFMKNKISDITLRINTEISTMVSNAFTFEPEGKGAV